MGTDQDDERTLHPVLRAVLWSALLLPVGLLFILIGALGWSEDRNDREKPAVRVEAVVTEVESLSSPNGTPTPRLTFVTEDGEIGSVLDRSGVVGETITVFRLGSGLYGWSVPDPEGGSLVPMFMLGAGGMCLFWILIVISEARGQLKERRQLAEQPDRSRRRS